MILKDKLSAYKNTSEISKINQQAGKNPVECSALTVEIINIALENCTGNKGHF